MAYRFPYGEFSIELSAGYPPVCGEEEKDPCFQDMLFSTGKLPSKLRPKDLRSWIVARLAALTDGAIQREEGGCFSNDGGDFAYRFKVTRGDGALVGKFGIILYPKRIEFAGFSTCDENMRDLFLGMLTAAPNQLEKCEIHVFDPDARVRSIFGWNGYGFLC